MYKILVADDEEKIRALIRKYAEFEGHTVTEASNGMEAVRLCAENDFDIIVMDVMMPELDGFSASREIRKHSDTPILMLSARGEEYDRISGFEFGADDYVVKPFSPKELMLRIDAIMKRAGARKNEEAPKKDGFSDPRPLRPRVVFRPGVGELRHHFKLDDRSAAVAYAGADAVVSGVAAADNYHVFALCRYVVPVLKPAVKQGFCCRFQKIHGKIHAVGIASLDFKVAGSAGAAAEDDRIVFRGQFLCLFAVNAASGDKADALVLHQLYPAEDDFLVKLHVRDSVHQKPAGAVGAFKNRDRVSAPV